MADRNCAIVKNTNNSNNDNGKVLTCRTPRRVCGSGPFQPGTGIGAARYSVCAFAAVPASSDDRRAQASQHLPESANQECLPMKSNWVERMFQLGRAFLYSPFAPVIPHAVAEPSVPQTGNAPSQD